MISQINTSNGIVITADYSESFPYTPDKSYPVRFNAQTKGLEAYSDEMGRWITLSKTVCIGLDPMMYDLFQWVSEKKQEEVRINEILEKHPEIKKMKDQVDVLIKLVQKTNDEESK